ncbi:MAG TPA: adenylate/guanylate cyclase domain-containing response regulator [Cyanobacteria bacterium UBA11149]|nr:adenylate/guanylate cyclase domain-containing response regulator [Cyanobacteria bacterium UBA11367]HBE58224.1 adenylate/guanylate cyclase domain-containing response regulator [Cyanobacteria bacterium UBA11366]HBK66917.1 adenylate/guanylate cyclase domain-containing response regulator [Cyanobacteria bacterium UBA11166]HBR76174.1 adenylate/guanylate cyclase domain-containing response regulator [Cyanobacteria bacterium UBA11159]HBS70750.1 adenylate/guanylate cyclase domain-containing response r
MSNSQPRILIVDDEPNNSFFLEELLLSEDYIPICASSGAEALTMAADSIPDLILLDVMMPDMDGFEVCQRLREDAKLQTIPVIFLTALDDDESRLRGLEMMGDDYLTKPINSQLLLTKIASILRLTNLRSQKAKQQVVAAWEVNDYISEKFRLFVPDQYLERIAPKGVESIQLGNAREEEITVLFCDIRGFTTITESQSVQETFKWLNGFFSLMSQAIADNHGFIDKFMGDAVLAIFDRTQNHAADAIDAALTMEERLIEFNCDRTRYNLELPIKIGIGIHTGMGLIGTVGSDQRMDSTVIGDVVNTAARLEELTKSYKCSILASNTTINHIKASYCQTENRKQFLFLLPHHTLKIRWLDRLIPRGKQQPLDIYEILRISTKMVDISPLPS